MGWELVSNSEGYDTGNSKIVLGENTKSLTLKLRVPGGWLVRHVLRASRLNRAGTQWDDHTITETMVFVPDSLEAMPEPIWADL